MVIGNLHRKEEGTRFMVSCFAETMVVTVKSLLGDVVKRIVLHLRDCSRKKRSEIFTQRARQD
jgi:hypothetical protein